MALSGLLASVEFSQTMVDCAATTCSEDPDFQAYYVDATYFIGGSRTYKDGLFKRDKVFNPVGDGGWGALAFSARYDVADLNDAVVMGGRQETVVLGATWYRDNFVRIMANYAHSELEERQLTATSLPMRSFCVRRSNFTKSAVRDAVKQKIFLSLIVGAADATRSG